MVPEIEPGLDDFRDLVSGDEPVVARLAAELPVDVRPLTAYSTLADESDSDYTFLLESAEKVASSDPNGAFESNGSTEDRHARFSFVGYNPDAVVAVGDGETSVEPLGNSPTIDFVESGSGDVLDSLRGTLPDVDLVGFSESERQQLSGGLVGYLAYDAVYDLWLENVGVERHSSEASVEMPDAEFVCNTQTLVFDELAGTTTLVFTPLVQPGDDLDAVHASLQAESERVASALADANPPNFGGFVRETERAGSREDYEQAVRRAKEHVRDGDIYQGVISRQRVLDGEVDPRGFYESLRAVNPSPYMYLFEYGDRTVVGASPETLVSVHGNTVVSNPIAGTCARGAGPVEDRRLAGELLADEKERSEHTMLVDLARNDVGRVCEPGSVRVEEFMNVLKYSHVQHIESTVTGRLSADADAFDATRASFPAGTLAGAPKIRAMELIDELETEPRGLYGGGVGYYSWSGDADFAIVIRTATIDSTGQRDRISVQAGAGVVADSDPASEYEETERKMGGVLAALERIESTSAECESAVLDEHAEASR